MNNSQWGVVVVDGALGLHKPQQSLEVLVADAFEAYERDGVGLYEQGGKKCVCVYNCASIDEKEFEMRMYVKCECSRHAKTNKCTRTYPTPHTTQTHHTSHITHHTSHITHHTSHITNTHHLTFGDNVNLGITGLAARRLANNQFVKDAAQQVH